MITRIEKINELENATIAFWIYSKALKSFRYISPAVSKMFETDIDKITDINVFRKVVHPEDQVKVIRNLNGGYTSNVDELDYRIITSTGKIKWLKNTAIAVKDSNSDVKTVIGCTYVRSKERTESKRNYFVNAANILRSLPGSYLIINRRGKVLQGLINKSEKFLRLNEASLDGRTISAVLDAAISKKIKNRLSEVTLGSDAICFEQLIYQKGKSYWFEIRMLPLSPDAVLICMRNITELWNKVSTTEKFYNMAEQSPEMIMMTDVLGTIEYVNPKLCEISGYSGSELIGKRTEIFNSGKHTKEFYKKLWGAILQGSTFEAEFQNLRKDGEIFIEKKSIAPLFSNGKITNFISTGRDVTQERKDELKANKYKQLLDTIAEKEQKSRTLSLIKSSENERKKIAGEIHEGVSQMLSAAMINLKSLSERRMTSSEDKNRVEVINHMVSEIINELRDISVNLSPSALYKFGLHSVIEQIVERNNRLKGALPIKFQSNLANLRFKNEIEINIYRIVEEAIKNMLKHSKASRTLLQLHHENGNFKLVIKDNGEGINMNLLEFKKINTFGILNIEARAKSIGAQLSINSKKNNGFTIELLLQTKTISV
jgi:PAS domain S-box-containing protein